MKQKYKFFAVSDIHGHAQQLIEALSDAGFDKNDKTHVFVGVGDYFDRGWQNPEVLELLESFERKVLVRGNHEDLLVRVMDRGFIDECDILNGTDITIGQFFGEDRIDRSGSIDKNADVEKKLRDFVDSTVNYFETDRYVIVHGWVPLLYDGVEPSVHPMWRRAPDSEWRAARFCEWTKAYALGLVLKAKSIVCGHRPCAWGAYFDNSRSVSDSSIFYADKMIAIDACTVNSKRVNVFVFEDMCEEGCLNFFAQ